MLLARLGDSTNRFSTMLPTVGRRTASGTPLPSLRKQCWRRSWTRSLTSPHGGLTGVGRVTVIASLMERVDEHADGLRALHLLGASEAVSDLSFRQLYTRVEARLSDGLEQRRGLSRWTADLIEPRLYTLAQRSGAGALTLAVVAWIMAAIRVGAAVKENGKEFGSLSYQGWRRFGLRDVVLPELERFHREDRPLRDVAAELAYRTVQQHLQIAWSRLQADLRRDVALLTAEGSQWFSRGKGFSGGRTASRLRQAVGWLTQLKLIDEQRNHNRWRPGLAGSPQNLG